MKEKEKPQTRETVDSAGIEIHTGNDDIVFWAKNPTDLRLVVNIYLKNLKELRRKVEETR